MRKRIVILIVSTILLGCQQKPTGDYVLFRVIDMGIDDHSQKFEREMYYAFEEFEFFQKDSLNFYGIPIKDKKDTTFYNYAGFNCNRSAFFRYQVLNRRYDTNDTMDIRFTSFSSNYQVLKLQGFSRSYTLIYKRRTE